MKKVCPGHFSLPKLTFKTCIAVFITCLPGIDSLGQTGSVVTVDTNNVLVLNGKKAFTIGFSPGPPNFGITPNGADALQELRDAGAQLFRITQSTDWDASVISTQQDALDWAQQHDMYCWVNLRELSKFSATDTNTPVKLANIVDTFRNHPALGLWKNFDEAWWGGVSVGDLQRGYNVIKQEDTNHPVVQTHAPRGTVSDLQPYNVAADVLAVDIYPVVASGSASNPPITNTQVSQVGDWTIALGQVANGQKLYWLIEQIAFSGTTPPSHTLVYPTFTQSRYMAYQSIINGARGLMFFGGNIAATLNAQDAPLGWNWTFWSNTLKQVVLELGDKGVLQDALVAPVSTRPITMSGTTYPDIEFCVREVPPSIYILASKREGPTVNVTFSGLPPSAGVGDVVYESGRTVTPQFGQFSDSFAQWDVHVYHFYNTNPVPTITAQPQGSTNTAGNSTAFHVGATGSGTLAYQWRKNGLNLSDGGNVWGATTADLTITNIQAGDAGTYSVAVTIGTAWATSSNANFTVLAPITITTQPTGLTNNAGATAAFNVSITGSNPRYQWRKNGTNINNGWNISGATTANLAVANLLNADAGYYAVVITNEFNSVTSSVAPLGVIDPAITNQPSNRVVPAGGTAVFTVGAAGTAPLSYRWKKGGVDMSNGGNVSGAASATLTLSSVQSNDIASYTVAISNNVGTTLSAAATLGLQPAPVILSQPTSRTNAAGTMATFSVGAAGSGLNYRWLKGGSGLSDGGHIFGAATPLLTVFPVSGADAANYSVIVSNAAGSVTSASASLSVTYPLPYYEPFNYDPWVTLANHTNNNFLVWNDVGTSTAGFSVGTFPYSLSVPGLAPSASNSILFGGLGKSARFSFAANTAVKTGTLYYSFIFSVQDATGLTPAGIFVAGFNNSIGTQTGQPTVIGTRLYIRSTVDGFNLGVSKNSSTDTDWVWDSRNFTNNQTIFVVGGYTFNSANTSDDISMLWLDPDPSSFGAGSAPSPDLITTSGSDISSSQIASFVFFQRSASEPAAMLADELRIGSTWASVTPPAGTYVMLTGSGFMNNGAFQFGYTNDGPQSLSVYASTNLVDWAAIGVPAQVSSGVYQFCDPAASSYPRRFYKVTTP